jgi:hypothetical protein
MALCYFEENLEQINRTVTYSHLQCHKPRPSVEECCDRCCRILCTAIEYVWSVLFTLVEFILPYVCGHVMRKVKPAILLDVLQFDRSDCVTVLSVRSCEKCAKADSQFISIMKRT